MIKLNGKELIVEKFPNKETKFKDFDNLILDGKNIVELKYETDQDLINLMFAKKRIDESNNVECKLFIWYMPYSRMDRKIKGDLFTLQYICELINWLNFSQVIVMEPHSEKTMQLLERAIDIYPVEEWLKQIKQEICFTEKDCIIFPDKGASKRYENNNYQNVCIFEKTRDPYTGTITNMVLKEGKVNKNAKCIIIDDLCSKGGTFLWSASILKQLGAGEIYLAVSHCEDTIFKGNALKNESPIEKVFTSRSMLNEDVIHSKIKFMKVEVLRYV